MKILVTGGCGFMGSDLVRRALNEGFEVVVVDSLTYAGDLRRIEKIIDRVKFYQTDIVDEVALNEILLTEKPDILIHYAAETHVDRSILAPQNFIKTNIIGTFNLLECAKKVKIRKFIHISTDEVYGELPKDIDLKFKETDPQRPKSPYSASKAGAEQLVYAYTKTYGLPAIILRASNNYGPWQYPEKLIPLTIAKAMLKEEIPVYGDGRNVRTWLYVEDFTEAVLTVLDRGKEGEIYNIGSSEERENIEVVKRILQILGEPETLIRYIPDRPGHDLRYALDTEKAERELLWQAKITFEEGLEKTIKWCRENIEWLIEKKNELSSFSEELFDYFFTLCEDSNFLS